MLGCTITEDFVIGELMLLLIPYNTQPLCAGLNGTISANTQGGAGGYVFSINSWRFPCGYCNIYNNRPKWLYIQHIAIFVDPDSIISSLEPDNFTLVLMMLAVTSDGSATVVAGGGTNIISTVGVHLAVMVQLQIIYLQVPTL